MKAMILAAGLGTRLKPWTDKHPKALAEVNGKSLLQRNIAYLLSYGIKDIVINVHHFADQIIEAVKKNNGWGANVIFSDESDEVLETGGGLMRAKTLLQDERDFLLMNADILTNLDLKAFAEKHIASGDIATLAVSDRQSSRYFLFDEHDKLCGWENINTGERKISRNTEYAQPKAFSGIHMISAGLFDLVTQTGKFSMVEVYLQLAASHSIGCCDHSGALLIDVGKPESLEKAAELFP